MEKSKTCWFRKLISEEMWRKNLVQKRKEEKKRKEFGSKKKKLSIAAKAATGDSERPIPSITFFFFCLGYSLPFLVLAFPKYVVILDCMLVFGHRILLHAEEQGTPKMLPNLES